MKHIPNYAVGIVGIYIFIAVAVLVYFLRAYFGVDQKK